MTGTESSDGNPQKAVHGQLGKLAIELGPLVAFFITYTQFGIFWATGAIIVATLMSLLASWLLYKSVAIMPIVAAVVVTIFGGLTLWLDDPTFLYRKPTIVNVLFAGALVVGLVTDRPIIKYLLGNQFHLTDEGWTKLTLRWIWFFIALALLNEVVWRNFSESTWVNFKVFGILPLTMIFAVFQVGLMKRYEVHE